MCIRVLGLVMLEWTVHQEEQTGALAAGVHGWSSKDCWTDGRATGIDAGRWKYLLGMWQQSEGSMRADCATPCPLTLVFGQRAHGTALSITNTTQLRERGPV
jgi:hypothetical protein